MSNIPRKSVDLRVCALCVQDGHVLMVEHRSFASGDPGVPDSYWILPGGVVERGESLDEAVRRELLEETGLVCNVGGMLFVKELLYPNSLSDGLGKGSRHHSVTLGFHCEVTGGTLTTGRDPEFSEERQVIIETRWLPLDDLAAYELYPPFLPGFIEEGVKNGFGHFCPRHYTSPR